MTRHLPALLLLLGTALFLYRARRLFARLVGQPQPMTACDEYIRQLREMQRGGL